MDIFEFKQGRVPLLINFPHSGTMLDAGMNEQTLTQEGQSLIDTDWHVPLLYPFAEEIGASTLKANYGRYVVDLNRDEHDTDLYPGQTKTGLCPLHIFDGAPIYKDGHAPDADEVSRRIETYWRPYHDKLAAELARLKAEHGYALLFDAHSIRTSVPRLFEGALPDLNLGTYNEKSCIPEIGNTVMKAAQETAYDTVLNKRFLGGYITRHYGQPDHDVQAIQMELTWQCYMDEETQRFDPEKGEKLSSALHHIIASFLDAAAKHYAH